MELNRVRVVHLCSSGGVGGMETSLLAMLEGLRTAVPTWPIAIVAPDPGKLLENAGRLGCEAVALPFPGPLARLGEASASASLAARAGAAPAAVLYGGRLRRTWRARWLHRHCRRHAVGAAIP